LPSALKHSNVAPIHSPPENVQPLIASGSSNKEIAAALGTAEATLKNQASSIFVKVRDRTRAVLRAIELGVLY